MKHINKVLRPVLVAASLLMLLGCKTDKSFVDHISIINNQLQFSYQTTFSKNISIDLDKDFSLGDYGTVRFYTDASDHLNIDINANYDLSNWAGTEATTLPYGNNFPGFVTTSLMEHMVKDEAGKYRLFLYNSKDTSAARKYVGTYLELNGIKNNVPQVSLTQDFSKNGTQYASLTIYGPKDVGGTLMPGGIFIVGDVSKVIRTKVGNGEWKISGPEAYLYQTKEAQQELFKRFQDAFAAEGVHIQ